MLNKSLPKTVSVTLGSSQHTDVDSSIQFYGHPGFNLQHHDVGEMGRNSTMWLHFQVTTVQILVITSTWRHAVTHSHALTSVRECRNFFIYVSGVKPQEEYFSGILRTCVWSLELYSCILLQRSHSIHLTLQQGFSNYNMDVSRA